MAELGTGWIRIAPDVSSITPEVSKALDSTQSAADQSGQKTGNRFISGVGNVVKKTAIGVGVAAGAAIGGGMTKGIGRLTAIENAEAQLTGLGHSAESVTGIMENANAAVVGTAYGLDAAATTAAMVVASGIEPGKELEGVLTTVADTAGIAGASMDEMGAIFGSVAARGKLQGDDLMQLTSRGIPVLQMLGDEVGKTAEEVSEMVSKGEIDFKTFEQALSSSIGGAAQEAGKTTTGAFSNMIAASGRLGATLAGPFYNQAASGFGAVNEGLDALNAKAGPVMEKFDSWLGSTGIPRLKEFGAAAQEGLAEAFQSDTFQSAASQAITSVTGIIDAGVGLLPVLGNIAGALGQAGAALGIGGWQLFLTTLDGVSAVASAVTPPLEAISGFMQEHPALVTAGVAAWAGFKTLPGITEKLSSGMQGLNNRVGRATEGLGTLNPTMQNLSKWSQESGVHMSKLDILMQATADTGSGAAQKIGQAYVNASRPLKEYSQSHRDAGAAAATAAIEASNGWDAADRQISRAGHGVVASVTGMAGTVRGVGAGAFAGLKDAVGGTVDALGGPLSLGLAAAAFAINDVSAANRAADEAQKAMTASARDAARAQEELRAAVAGTTGNLDEEGLAAAARVAKGSLSELIEVGGRKFSFADNINQSTVAVDELAAKIPGMYTEAGKASIEANREIKTTRSTLKELEKGAEEVGIPMEDLYDVIAAGGPEFDDLVTHLRGTNDAGNAAADSLEEARSKIEDVVESAKNVDPAFAQASEAIGVLADSSSSAETKLSALESLMESMGLVPKMAEEAMMDAAAAVDKVVESATAADMPVEELGDALFGLDGKLEPTNSSARQLHEHLSTLRGELQTVALSGGDTTAAFEQMQPGLSVLREEFGLTEGQINDLVNSYGLIPNVIDTAVNLDGASEVTKDLASVWSQLDGIPEDKPINVGVLDEDAVEALEELGYQVDDLEDGDFEVHGHTEEAQENLQQVVDRMASLDGTEVDASLALDNTTFELNYAQANSLLNELDIQEPTPHAQMIIDNLLAEGDIAMGDLAVLASQTPTPIADVATELLDLGVSDSHGKLTTLQNTPTKPIVDADTGPLERAVNWAKQLLGSITGRTVNISGAGAGGHSSFAHGGRIPKLAHGGRLPVTGPGTATIDGILGVDGRGMPTARVNRGEWVVTEGRSEQFNNTLGAINSGSPQDIVNALHADMPGLQALASGGVVGSITDLVNRHFPEMTITSTYRPGDTGYHGRNLAVDFSNGTDITPQMDKAARFFNEKYGDQLEQLIHWGPWNIGAGEPVGDGNGFYGPGTMADHRNHVHLAAEEPLSETVSASIGNAVAIAAGLKPVPEEMLSSQSMNWASPEGTDVDWGAASDLYRAAAQFAGARDRVNVQVGTRETRTSMSPGVIDQASGQSSSYQGEEWGHDFFVHEIARSAQDHGLPERGAMIGLGTGYVEAGDPLRMWANRRVPESLNYRHDALGSDHDSVGIFQQRDNGAWGTVAQRMNPYESAGMFFSAMLNKFPRWQHMDPGAVAQGVQVSAFPDRYGKVMDKALDEVRSTGLYDQGGWLPHGGMALNLSRQPEPVLTGGQWGDVSGMVQQLPHLVRNLDRLIPVLEATARTGAFTGAPGGLVDENSPLVIGALKLHDIGVQIQDQAEQAEADFRAAGLELADWTSQNLKMFDNTQIVMDAEQGLQDTRRQNAEDLVTLQKAEKAVRDARKIAAEAQKESANLSTSQQRKIEDAERSLDEARASSAETAKEAESRAKKIEDAERKLSRAREDAAADLAKSQDEKDEAAAKAIEDVTKAENELVNARSNVEGATDRLEAAERTLAAARIQVVADIASSTQNAFDSAFSSLANFVGEITRLGGIVHDTQQSVSQLEQEQLGLQVNAIKTANDLRIAEWDVSRARMEGMVNLAIAEGNLADAREGHIVMGATSVDGLGTAVSRFRDLGMTAADQLGTSISVNADEVAAAEAALSKARADSAILDLEAQRRAQAASTAAAKATIIQAQSAEILQAQTHQLAQQTAQLYGMNNTQQTALGQRVTGGQKTAGGILGIFGALATGALGVATGNPLALAAAVGMGAKGISDTVSGIGLLRNHDKQAADEAWDALPTWDKVQLGLGAVGGVATTGAGIAAGVHTGNADWITAGMDAGASVWDATTSGLAERQQWAFDRIEAEYQDSLDNINGRYDRELADLELQDAVNEADYLMQLEALRAESAYQELMQSIAESSTKAESEALVQAAEVAAARRDDLLTAARETNELLKQDVNLQIPAGQAWTSDQLEGYMQTLFDQIDGVNARIDQIDTGDEPTGIDIVMSQR